MREYSKKPKNQSRTIDSNPRASKQASTDIILQRYKPNMQQYTSKEDEDLMQGKSETAPTTEQQVIQQEEKINNTRLPDDLKTGVENLSSYFMDDVRVHYNSDNPAQLHVLAYTQGTDIHMVPRQEKHLPHEAWHVVQHKQGRVQHTMQLQEMTMNDDEEVEKEANVMGKKAHELMVYKSSIQHLKLPNSSRIGVLSVQRMKFSRFRWMQNPFNWGWKYNEKEKELLSIEKKLKNTLTAHKTLFQRLVW